MNEILMGLNRLERRIGMDGEAVRIQLNSISNCLSDYGPRRRIGSFDETLASLSERWGVASSSAEFPLLSLDCYLSGDDESSDPSSGNDEPMTRGRDRQESADMIGPVDVDMQSALSNSCISSPSPADVNANKKSGSSECNVRSDPVPGIGESKTRGRVRRKKTKKGARSRPQLNGFHLSVKSIRRPINKLKGRKKVMVAHHYWLKPGEDMTCPLWLKHQISHCHRASFDLCWPKDPSIIVAHI